jgi:hypothetical protein
MHLPHHNIWKDVDFKKGFKKPLPYIVILIVFIVFSILAYLDSNL